MLMSKFAVVFRSWLYMVALKVAILRMVIGSLILSWGANWCNTCKSTASLNSKKTGPLKEIFTGTA